MQQEAQIQIHEREYKCRHCGRRANNKSNGPTIPGSERREREPGVKKEDKEEEQGQMKGSNKMGADNGCDNKKD